MLTECVIFKSLFKSILTKPILTRTRTRPTMQTPARRLKR